MIKEFSLRVSNVYRSSVKYWQIFKISFIQEFAYKVSFVMWRFRNVLQIFVAFFLWDKIFASSNSVFFGYDRSRILTYVFSIILVRALILSARAIDVSNDIAQGELSNYLVKPINYFKYWFTRDVASKALNVSFALVEFFILYLLLKPPLYFQTDVATIITFLISLLIAIILYFLVIFIVSSVPFWSPELGWGSFFLVNIILVEFLSGAAFPIDILPLGIQSFVMATPFPYLIYFPVQVYLGKISGALMIKELVVSLTWVLILGFSLKRIWARGLKVYESIGR